MTSLSGKIAWVIDAMLPMGGIARDGHRRLREIRLVFPKLPAVGMIVGRSAQIAVGAHLAVTVIAVDRAFGRVDRDVIEVDAEPVTLRVAIDSLSD